MGFYSRLISHDCVSKITLASPLASRPWHVIHVPHCAEVPQGSGPFQVQGSKFPMLVFCHFSCVNPSSSNGPENWKTKHWRPPLASGWYIAMCAMYLSDKIVFGVEAAISCLIWNIIELWLILWIRCIYTHHSCFTMICIHGQIINIHRWIRRKRCVSWLFSQWSVVLECQIHIVHHRQYHDHRL